MSIIQMNTLRAPEQTSSSDLTRLIYSSNHGGICRQATREIERISHFNNERDQITGIMLVSDEDFVQLIEGSRQAVTNCFMRIMRDRRHRNIEIMCAQDAESRLFSTWSKSSARTSRLHENSPIRQLMERLPDQRHLPALQIDQAFRFMSNRMDQTRRNSAHRTTTTKLGIRLQHRSND